MDDIYFFGYLTIASEFGQTILDLIYVVDRVCCFGVSTFWHILSFLHVFATISSIYAPFVTERFSLNSSFFSVFWSRMIWTRSSFGEFRVDMVKGLWIRSLGYSRASNDYIIWIPPTYVLGFLHAFGFASDD